MCLLGRFSITQTTIHSSMEHASLAMIEHDTNKSMLVLAMIGNVLSDSRDNERQRLQRRQWKVHISWRYSHSACLSRFNKMFSL